MQIKRKRKGCVEKMEGKVQKIIKEYAILSAGVLLVAIGVYFFKFPNNFSIGGVTGFALLVSSMTNGAISSGNLVMIVNMVLLVIGFFVLGKEFSSKTAYGSILLSLAIKFFEVVCPMDRPFTQEPVLELAFAVALPALGAAILFNCGGSTGGTDIVAMILKKYSSFNIGQALLYTDLLLTLATFLVFDVQTGFLSILGLVLKSLVVDNVIESLNLCKYFTVICENPEPISKFITETLHRSATICDGTGAFTKTPKKIIMTVMTRPEAVMLQKHIKEVEPTAFILITNTSEIIGRGFRGI